MLPDTAQPYLLKYTGIPKARGRFSGGSTGTVLLLLRGFATHLSPPLARLSPTMSALITELFWGIKKPALVLKAGLWDEKKGSESRTKSLSRWLLTKNQKPYKKSSQKIRKVCPIYGIV